jgi:hypothetical protein
MTKTSPRETIYVWINYPRIGNTETSPRETTYVWINYPRIGKYRDLSEGKKNLYDV